MKRTAPEPSYIGDCPICGRKMFDDGSVNKHHLIPKCRGGKETFYLHMVCHQKIHSLWTDKELEEEFSDPATIKEHEEIQKFVIWLDKKTPGFYIISKESNHKKSKRRR